MIDDMLLPAAILAHLGAAEMAGGRGGGRGGVS